MGLTSIKVEKYNELSARIDGAERIVLLTHVNPDGDALGTMLGLNRYLEKKGKRPVMALPNRFPAFLDFLPGSRQILVHEEQGEKAEKAVREASLIICLDFNDAGRLKGMQESFDASGAFKVLVDHHPGNPVFPDLAFSETEISSSAELMFHLIAGMDGDALIDPETAECLYTGIMTDTGCFQFGSSRPATFETVAQLLARGIDKDAIFSRVYENYTADRMRLMGYCMNEKMKLIAGGKAAHISLSMEELARFNHRIGDTEGFVNLPFSIGGVVASALIVEKEDQVKISFRSKGDIEINRFAAEHFLGGGHRNAAGGESYDGLEETVRRFEKTITEFLKAKS